MGWEWVCLYEGVLRGFYGGLLAYVPGCCLAGGVEGHVPGVMSCPELPWFLGPGKAVCVCCWWFGSCGHEMSQFEKVTGSVRYGSERCVLV
ncbi:hypothetical protein BKA65DRAFT_494614 [Rhexocercosporidium sp. MPI-PUGE-AT-0058]|nr:hypothetical protein BKA65DRAFT_494614 [Rhexocercosporidium sp. MPI-PUGE-AT-0058]